MASVLWYVAGAVTGAGLMFISNYVMYRAVIAERAKNTREIERLRRCCEKMRSERDQFERCGETRDAYQRGYDRWRENYTQADKVVRAFNGRSVRVGQVREG